MARPAGLERGTQVRSRRAALKRAIAAGDVDLPDLLRGGQAEAFEEVALDMRIDDLVRSVPGIGVTGAAAIVDPHHGCRLSALTIRRRNQIAKAIGKETDS